MANKIDKAYVKEQREAAKRQLESDGRTWTEYFLKNDGATGSYVTFRTASNPDAGVPAGLREVKVAVQPGAPPTLSTWWAPLARQTTKEEQLATNSQARDADAFINQNTQAVASRNAYNQMAAKLRASKDAQHVPDWMKTAMNVVDVGAHLGTELTHFGEAAKVASVLTGIPLTMGEAMHQQAERETAQIEDLEAKARAADAMDVNMRDAAQHFYGGGIALPISERARAAWRARGVRF